ncbi:MAG: dihydrodipicolinate synthase family protein [Kiritimatiellae bacterium]|nr:dihydrodipicolinate synthase family protein [Kiritimatiellia bacterium]
MTLCTLFAAAQIGGVFPLLCTPYAEDGSLDCATLAKEAQFVADCGADGIIWPAANDAMKWLSPEEEKLGLEAIASAIDGRDVWFSPCCPGTNTADMLRRVNVANEISAKHPGLKTTMLVRMLDDAKGDADYERQYDTLASATKLPVIIQTYNNKSPMPSAKLLIDLAKRHPETYGWYKVEGTGKGIIPCARELVAAKPVVKTVFTGWGGRDWLYHYRRVGTRGVISQRPMYADLMVKIWRALEGESRPVATETADALFAKFMYLRNLEDSIPAPEMRGWNLYVLKKRGVFRNTLSRTKKRSDGTWEVSSVDLSVTDTAEVDARLEYALGGISEK